ncbi:response regulator containing a CheY-like receiver domain and an HD-GYP domain [Marinitoga piezophila KA3]|uniref:Response regulator containing a CheY-like receiver domain and an HD-GYP domain n=1 Tax=Marinitoga piezophila (strain DSM 14283 / JCM 11233 / KA3) TaxID=443254 RepID=H2J4Z4_MARPK|nr:MULTISPECIES: HD domain-containing phosphohydrolase [Marinitoga]AEX86011.1 response regulator containing a CheY-like receiver domain and an HD-GYP domain [Marinitoga piezophila KA3]
MRREYSVRELFDRMSLIFLFLIMLLLLPPNIYMNIRKETCYKEKIYDKISNFFFTEITREINNQLLTEKAEKVSIVENNIENALKDVGSLGGYSVIKDKELLTFYKVNDSYYVKRVFLPNIIKNVARKLEFEENFMVVDYNKKIIYSNIEKNVNLKDKNLNLKGLVKIGDAFYYSRFNNDTFTYYPFYLLIDINVHIWDYIIKTSIQWIAILLIIFIIVFYIEKSHYEKIRRNIEEFSEKSKIIGEKLIHGEDTKFEVPKTNIKEIDDIGKTLFMMFLQNIEYMKKNKKLIQEILKLLGNISEFRDEITGNHIIRVGKVSRIIAEEVFEDKKKVEMIYYAAQLHDIGKIGIPDSILQKPGKLDDDEFEIMKKHTTIGYEILKKVDDELFEMASKIALYHHEKYDGSGYPEGLKGEEIPIEGRIVAVCDVFDALLSERPYKKAFEFEEGVKIIMSGEGKHFDPKIVEIFVNNIDKIRNLYKNMGEKE